MKFKNYKYILLIVMIAITFIGHSQDNTINELDLRKWSLRSQGVQLGTSMGLTLGVYEYQFDGKRLIETPLLFKINIIGDLSVLGGATFDFFEVRSRMTNQIDASATLGIQYDINDDAYIQGLFNYQIINTNNPYNYKAYSPSSFSIRSGFKF
nr:hypothetical protein [uncultured Psychroserpens sp.]